MVRFFKKCYVSIIFAFLYAPILVLTLYSFNDSRSRGNWGGFTLRWYSELFQNRQILSSLYNTVMIAVLSAVIATVIGTAAAIGLHALQGYKRKVVMNLTYIPVINPDIVTGISLMLLFVFSNLKLGFLTMLLAHITFNIPYVILSVLPKLKQLDSNLYEAALDLGATPWYAFRHVILPEIMPGVVTGLLLAFTLSIDDFVISFFTTGSGVANLSITVYSMARLGINPTINAVSTLMFLSVLILLIVVNLRTNKDNPKRGRVNEKQAYNRSRRFSTARSRIHEHAR
ncbi:MAG: ABC transporter permease [Firmicutes bacterium]|jgi:spermidine/putrescine transport system permease protein|nr:ABC transporter permease [Bacillota bacterium]